MFMDISSELIHSLLPLFMVSLGASVSMIGLVEGIAEATSSITKVFSGVTSDYFKNRKFPVVLGYGLAAITKPIFPLATTIGWVLAGRFIDRIGKGIRGAPRDALIADLVPKELRGTAYGLRQSLDTTGAFLGPVLAIVCMAWFANNLKAVMWVAVVPAFIAAGLIALAVKEPESSSDASLSQSRLKLSDVKRLTRRYWFIVVLGAVFSLARFSEAFLILRARDIGLAIGLVPLILIVMNVVYALLAYPAGVLSDRIPARTLLLSGFSVLIASDLVLAMAHSPMVVFLGAALWGGHMALTQGLLSKLIADTSPNDLRGTAFGVFNLFGGVAVLLASVIAGGLWTALGPSATFFAGAAFAGFALLGLVFFHPGSQELQKASH